MLKIDKDNSSVMWSIIVSDTMTTNVVCDSELLQHRFRKLDVAYIWYQTIVSFDSLPCITIYSWWALKIDVLALNARIKNLLFAVPQHFNENVHGY